MRTNPWAFGVIFLVFVGFLFINNFELPKILFLKKTDTADALIIETKKVVGRIPTTTDIINTYIFKNNDSIFIASFRTPSYKKAQVIGDSLKIKFDIKNPNNNKVIGYYRNIQNKAFAYREQLEFRDNDIDEKKYLVLKNSVFTLTEYKEDTSISSKTGGVYEKQGDTIKLSPLVKFSYDKNNDFETVIPLNNNIKNRYFIILYKDRVQEIKSL